MRITLELGRAMGLVACHWHLLPTYWRHRWLWIDLKLERSDTIAGFVLMLAGCEFSAMVQL